jgi:ADP-ribose pyrophosphatase
MEKTLKEIQVYKGDFIDIYEDEVLVLENQNKAKRIYAKHPGGASILALSRDNKILLVTQYRYPIKGESIEIPAGKKDSKEEDGLRCAKRELEEETGYNSDDITLLFKTYPCIGYSDEILDIYIAKNIYKIDNPKQADEDEFINVFFYDQEQAKQLLATEKIMDAKTLIALQYYTQMKF